MPVAFWHFGHDLLVVATLLAGEEEPLLLSCAAVRGEWLGHSSERGRFCPGLLELQRQAASTARLHAAALAAHEVSDDADAIELEESGRRLRFSRAWIDHIVALFDAARLPLVALEDETAARDHLVRFFGPAGEKRSGERSLADDPLAAVSVAPACEPTAAALGRLLAVPVGLALGCFGVSGER